MSLQPVFLDGAWREAHQPLDSFSAINPTTGEVLPEVYPVSSIADIEQALQAAHKVAQVNLPADAIADFLEAFARAIEARSTELVEQAALETGLAKESRLRTVELPRTTTQLRQAAAAARERSWCHATIDTKNRIRSKFAALGGPVAVFGPNNFPFAFNSLAGGDFAAAIAAGNPVIAKANPGHPGTTRIFAEAASEALQKGTLPQSMVQMLYHTHPTDGLKLVAHPLLGATAFTGSKAAGLRLKEAADKAGKPIYLEMSSINPVFLLPNALAERLPEIVSDFCNSCLASTGQFCTSPGLVILLQGPQGEAFLRNTAERLQATPSDVLLSKNSPEQLSRAITIMKQNGAQIVTGGAKVAGAGYRFENTLLQVAASTFLEHAQALQTEAFGNASLVVLARDRSELLAIAESLEGNLTSTIYSHRQGLDDELYDSIEPLLRKRVGRLLNDKMPTGVALSPAMMHGGPFPASGHPGFTAVGIPGSLLRFAALHSYDNVRDHRLPEELQDKNPTGQTWRFIDGVWTQRDLISPSGSSL